VAFSPDGKILASGGCAKPIDKGACSQGEIRLWDVATRQPIGSPLTGHKAAVWSLAFSPDGKTLASASQDSTVILWDVAAHQPITPPLKGHADMAVSVAFSPDGRTVASGSKDTNIILWDVSLESWKSRACRIANRNLTRAEWDQFIGPDMPYQRSCPALPPGEGVRPGL
jgi:WD40 repeat protein